MSISIKKLATCLGLDGEVRIVHDFFGYAFGGRTRASSLLTQARLLTGPHVNLNLIRVGEEFFTDEDKAKIDAAVERMRELYAAVQIGVGRLRHYLIHEGDAVDSFVVGGVLTFDWAAQVLTNDWSAGNGELDVFLVLHWSSDRPGKKGQAPINGTCDKDDGLCESTGAVFSLEAEKGRSTGTVMAHEVGHYLGLNHIDDLSSEDVDEDDDGNVDPKFETQRENLMFPRLPNGGKIEPWQRLLMTAHCFMRPGCAP